ncbi:MAG: GIY-YIG nuclease family protein [Candidatus Endonucleobacter bathymodioli]|uniref:GIY-YIG nuclease family protein n=1 Tax=Candidatus Endonucleibacter bathymodioli TaxID=539814 RepID=A0AA90NM16_9GAMM|nr:GIY-YIG nuclease family protein [Candidatus Endonucleobacter bathymodioli]
MIWASDQSIYTGITKDIRRRWKQHDTCIRGAKFFRGRKPEYLLYLEAGHNQSSALQKEIMIKKLTHSQKWHFISNSQHNEAETLRLHLPVWPQQT